MGGVNISGKCYIYRNVVFDRVAPEKIKIGKNVTITDDVKILTHFLDPCQAGRHYRIDDVVIEDDVFIGIGAIICNSVIGISFSLNDSLEIATTIFIIVYYSRSAA